jgi:predicted component of type VI protein secretion system
VFTNDEFALRIRDLGSTNGTFLNGERLRTAAILKSGDRVTVGKLEFVVMLGDDAQQDSESNRQAPAAVGANNDDTRTVAASETLTEIPAVPVPLPPPVPTSDTAMYPAGSVPGFAAAGYPPQFPQQPYPYPGYPPMYPGYYMPTAPYGAPAGYPAQVAAPTAAQQAANQMPETRLPDPATTGAKAPEPATKPQGDKADKAGAPANVPESAAGIIKQYLQRRPTSSQ